MLLRQQIGNVERLQVKEASLSDLREQTVISLPHCRYLIRFVYQEKIQASDPMLRTLQNDFSFSIKLVLSISLLFLAFIHHFFIGALHFLCFSTFLISNHIG